jgi:hypothetical protein
MYFSQLSSTFCQTTHVFGVLLDIQMLVNKLFWKVKGSKLHQENTLLVIANTKGNEVVLENHSATLHSHHACQPPHQVMSERCHAGT